MLTFQYTPQYLHTYYYQLKLEKNGSYNIITPKSMDDIFKNMLINTGCFKGRPIPDHVWSKKGK